LGVGLVRFDFLTDKENRHLWFLQGGQMDRSSDVLKGLQFNEIDGVNWDGLSAEERAEALCKLLCRVIEQNNRTGREALVTILNLRGRPPTSGELEQVKTQLRREEEEQAKYWLDYYDDYAGPEGRSEDWRDPEHERRIKQAISIAISDALSHVRAMVELSSDTEPPENLSLGEAASLFAKVAEIKPDKSRIRREIQKGLIKRTPDGRITSEVVARRAIRVWRNKRGRAEVPKLVHDKVCPECGQPTHALIGASKICRNCFVKSYELTDDSPA